MISTSHIVYARTPSYSTLSLVCCWYFAITLYQYSEPQQLCCHLYITLIIVARKFYTSVLLNHTVCCLLMHRIDCVPHSQNAMNVVRCVGCNNDLYCIFMLHSRVTCTCQCMEYTCCSACYSYCIMMQQLMSPTSGTGSAWSQWRQCYCHLI